MQYVEYRLVDGQLERSVREALDGAAPEEPRVMLRGIESATSGYNYRGQWLDGWPGGANAMPEAVRLKLQLAGLGREREGVVWGKSGAGRGGLEGERLTKTKKKTNIVTNDREI